ncbi:MAG: hypothetical protein B6I18_06740 [Bacteroidetes bacterium 4572_112]|nr:MAG: hypothetical protein B6I18_06740 [Bacteroidetes bacterium 4572_112]
MTNILKTLFIFSTLFVLISLSSCSEYDPQHKEVPENLIDKSEFTNIMLDIRLAEVIIRQDVTKNNGNNTDSITNYYYSFVFDKHNISQEQFQVNLDYYTSNPSELDDINKAVVDSLNLLKERVKPNNN